MASGPSSSLISFIASFMSKNFVLLDSHYSISSIPRVSILTLSLISLCDIILTFGTNFSTKRRIGSLIGGDMIINGVKPLPMHSSDFFHNGG